MKVLFKKTVAACLSGVVAIGFAAGAVGCGKGNGASGNSGDYELDFRTVYAMAQEKGYTGTLEELIAAFKGEKGEPGTGIEYISVNEAGELIFSLTDGRTVNCGKIAGGETQSGTDAALAARLYAAVREASFAGCDYKIMGGSRNIPMSVRSSYVSMYGAVDFSEGFSADRYAMLSVSNHIESITTTSYELSFIRGNEVYGAQSEEGETFAELSEGIKTDGARLTKTESETNLQQITPMLPFLKNVVKNLPALLGGRVEQTESGYRLIYDVGEELSQLYAWLTSLAETIDADKDMPLAQFVLLPSVADKIGTLLENITAKELVDFVTAQRLNSADGTTSSEGYYEAFYEMFPRYEDGETAIEYLAECMSGAIGGRKIYSLLCTALFGVDPSQLPEEMLPSLSERVKVLPSKDYMYETWANLGLLMPGSHYLEWSDVKGTVEILFDADEKLTGLEVFFAEDSFDVYRSITVEVDFLKEKPRLFDLSFYGG